MGSCVCDLYTHISLIFVSHLGTNSIISTYSQLILELFLPLHELNQILFNLADLIKSIYCLILAHVYEYLLSNSGWTCIVLVGGRARLHEIDLLAQVSFGVEERLVVFGEALGALGLTLHHELVYARPEHMLEDDVLAVGVNALGAAHAHNREERLGGRGRVVMMMMM